MPAEGRAASAPRKAADFGGLVVGGAISLAALGLVLSWSGWEQLQQALSDADLRWVAVGAAIYILSLLARAASWGTLLGWRASFGRVVGTLSEGYLMNNLLPGRLGEVGRAVLLGRRPGFSPAMVLSSIVGERLLDVFLGLSLLVGLWPYAVGAAWARSVATYGGLALAVALGVVVLTAVRPAVVSRILYRLPGGEGRWRRVWEGWQQGVAALARPKTAAIAFTWMLLGWCLAGLEFWVILRAFLPDAPLTWALMSLALIALSAGIPSAPASLGVFEAAAAAALAPFGVDPGTAVAFGLVLHGVNVALSSTLGALTLAGEGETLLGAFHAARRWVRSET